ncbi:MAG: AAA family ATPase [bacterium]
MDKPTATELPTEGEGNGHIQKIVGSMAPTFPTRELKFVYSDDTGQSGNSRAFILGEGIKVEIASLQSIPPGAFLGTLIRMPLDDAKRFSKLEAVGRQDEILPTLKLLEPRLRRLAVLVTGGVPIVNGDIGVGRLIPLPLMGEGIGRLLSLALVIFDSPRGVVLIDEIENGLHYSAMVDVWKAIAEATRRSEAQIFATTHSWECIKAAHEAFTASGIYDFRLHRLDRAKDKILVVTYDQEMLDAAMVTDLEVR